jgi:hypothetical protein
MRRFHLVRDEDPSGISGTGIVAEGLLFSSGWVALQFLPKIKNVYSVYPYQNMTDMYEIHGHNGKTRIEFLDPEENR